MGANTSVESIEAAINAINEEVRKAFALHDKIFQFSNNIDWSDDKGTNFNATLRELMLDIMRPMPALKKTRDRLVALKDIVEKYNHGVQF